MKRLPRWLPYALLLAGAALRVSGLLAGSFWFDEAYNVYLSRLPILEAVRFEYTDYNPPLWQLVVNPFIWLLGENELAVRLPSLLAGLAALYLGWKIWERYGFPVSLFPAPRLLAALLLAGLPILLWNSQDGRVYALYSLLYLMGIWFAWRASWLGFGAALGLLLWSHSTGGFYAVGLVAGALVTRPSRYRSILAAAALAGLPFVVWLPSLLKGSSFFIYPLSLPSLLNSLTLAFYVGLNNQGLYNLSGLLVAGSILAAAALTVYRAIRGKGWGPFRISPLAVYSLLPVLLIIAVSLYRNILIYRVLAPAVIPLALWVVMELTPRKLTWFSSIPAAWAAVTLAALALWYPTARGGTPSLRDMAELINEQSRAGDIVIHGTGTSYLPMSLYLQEPGYLLDFPQHDRLLQNRLIDRFSIPKTGFENLAGKRIWIVWAKDSLVSKPAQEVLNQFTSGGVMVGNVHYWQYSNIEIYLTDLRSVKNGP